MKTFFAGTLIILSLLTPSLVRAKVKKGNVSVVSARGSEPVSTKNVSEPVKPKMLEEALKKMAKQQSESDKTEQPKQNAAPSRPIVSESSPTSDLGVSRGKLQMQGALKK